MKKINNLFNIIIFTVLISSVSFGSDIVNSVKKDTTKWQELFSQDKVEELNKFGDQLNDHANDFISKPNLVTFIEWFYNYQQTLNQDNIASKLVELKLVDQNYYVSASSGSKDSIHENSTHIVISSSKIDSYKAYVFAYRFEISSLQPEQSNRKYREFKISVYNSQCFTRSNEICKVALFLKDGKLKGILAPSKQGDTSFTDSAKEKNILDFSHNSEIRSKYYLSNEKLNEIEIQKEREKQEKEYKENLQQWTEKLSQKTSEIIKSQNFHQTIFSQDQKLLEQIKLAQNEFQKYMNAKADSMTTNGQVIQEKIIDNISYYGDKINKHKENIQINEKYMLNMRFKYSSCSLSLIGLNALSYDIVVFHGGQKPEFSFRLMPNSIDRHLENYFFKLYENQLPEKLKGFDTLGPDLCSVINNAVNGLSDNKNLPNDVNNLQEYIQKSKNNKVSNKRKEKPQELNEPDNKLRKLNNNQDKLNQHSLEDFETVIK